MNTFQSEVTVGDFRISHVKEPGISLVQMPNFHAHPTYEFFYLINGERIYYINGTEYCVKRGDLLLLDRNVIHKTISTLVPDYERILLQIPQSLINSFRYHDFNPEDCFRFTAPVFSLPKKDQTVIESALFAIFDEAEHKHAGYLAAIQTLLIQILIRVHRYAQSADHVVVQSSHVNNKIADIVYYIGQNYMKPLSLNQIAREFHISSAHLARTFKKVTGLTLIEYLNIVRVNEARQMLRRNDQSISEIALALGYGSITHFERVFKKASGYTPSTYRKLTRQ